ncbi:MAG TPA: FAD-binding oxidoreductase [Streptosporangiales bacterium]
MPKTSDAALRYRDLSFWFATVPGSLEPRPSLPGTTDVDVAIVGAGFTGLWTAYYLLEADPSLRVAVVEAEIAGYGASGRNGGWCSALYPVSVSTLAREHGPDAATAQYLAMRDSVAEIARVVAVEDIDADLAVGGTIRLARSGPQLERARAEVEEYRRFGLDLELLDADAARGRLDATSTVGGTYTPHCAAIHPGKLVRRLAEIVEARGATVYERTRATSVAPRVVHTEHGDVRAEIVVRATEGYTARLAGLRRAAVPIYSLVIATAPLPASTWAQIGLVRRETFSDFRHLIIYGQRTADDRIVFGGRGAPYHFGSRIRPEFDRDERVFELLRQTLVELFPLVAGATITHRWGGALGITRDWHATVGLNRGTGLAWAGGYVGDGVGTTNLAGRTLRDLILGRHTPLTGLPWVGHRSPVWEPEPLRWLGANAGLRAMTWADAAESRGGGPSRLAAVVDRALGR